MSEPSAPVVRVENLGKTYRVYSRPWDRLLEAISRRPRHRPFHALEGLSFQLTGGEGLGIIGENGAGKSTLLKILSGITVPTTGTAEVRGKVASILELGSGFHPEFTGRQNITLNAAMLGLSEEELRRKMPEIIAFSELGEFIDQPVKCYSTGMAMRLGFSIATQVEPEVLIIDEALSVGDGYFQKKCMDRLLAFVNSGGTLLFCSHALYYISAFCRRALWLRNGRVAALGPVDEVVRRYENFLLEKEPSERPVLDEPERPGPARLLATRLLQPPREQDGHGIYRYGDGWLLEIEWEAENPRLLFHLGVGIDRIDGVQIASFSTHREGLPPFSGRRRYRSVLRVPSLSLLKGEFSIYIFLLDEGALHPYDSRILHRAFAVHGEGYETGLIKLEHRWEHERLAVRPHQQAV